MTDIKSIDIKRDFKGVTCKGWLLSEKYDGVQGVWDGHKMLTRTGKLINAPQWWLRHLPSVPLIGELWVGRGCFDEASGIVRGSYSDKWSKVKYLVFKGNPDVSIGKYGQHVRRRRILKEETAHIIYERILQRGGEGIVLNQQVEPYEVVKVKPIHDIDVKVCGYVPGKGRNEGRAGALLAHERDGRRVKVGSGLSDAVRDNPPAIGTVIKISYTGRTPSGQPRFPRFVGVRAETDFV